MRKKAFIKIFWILGIGFLVFIFSFKIYAAWWNGNSTLEDHEDYVNQNNSNNNISNSNPKSKAQILCESTASEDARIWGDKLGSCECPEWTRRINDKWCRSCAEPDVCCGIELNTKVPFIGDCIELTKKCIDGTCPNWYKCDEKSNKCRVEKTDPNQTVIDEEEAFPTLMGWLIRILVTIIMLWSFMAILAGGVMISAAWSDEQRATKGKKLIIDVVIALAILGASGVILRLINPNFFW